MTTTQATAPTTRLIGRCTTKGCREVGSVATKAERHGCPTHGTMIWKRVQGTFVATKACDSRCTGARGLHCDCSCAGANHGAGVGR